MTGVYSDTSNIVDDTTADADDVKIPIDALDTALAALHTAIIGTTTPRALTASDIGSGVFDNARINWAAPSAIGTGTPAAGNFSTGSFTSTITGTILTLQRSAGAVLNLSGSAGNSSLLAFQTSNVPRWGWYTDASAESGGNAGTNLGLIRYNDAGSVIDIPILVTRSTGKILLGTEVEMDGDLNHDGSNVGFFGTTPAARSTGWTTFTNLNSDKTCNADSTSTGELADILGTLIEYLKLIGLLAA